MRTVWKATALGLLLTCTTGAFAQGKSEAESGLVGIHLFDHGMRLLNLYGQPDDIQSINGPSTSAPVGGGGAGSPFGSGGRRPVGGAQTGGDNGGDGGPVGSQSDLNDPFGFSDPLGMQTSGPPPGFRMPGAGGFGNQGGPPSLGGGGGTSQPGGMPPGYPGGGMPSGYPGGMPPGMPNGMPPGFGAPSGFGGTPPPSSGGTASSGSYVRWVYKRGGGKYGFILDKTNKIIQIEAIGMDDPRVHTRKGLTFGASFVKVIKTYGFPDSYEVAGNTITMRYLLKNKVVFRLNRLGLDKPHVVTGILVAAAKS